MCRKLTWTFAYHRGDAAAGHATDRGAGPRRGRRGLRGAPRPRWWGGRRIEPGAQTGALAATLVPETQLGLDIPRFAVANRQLDSGLRVGVEIVACARPGRRGDWRWAPAPSDDPPEREGLAHLVEHLVYHAHANGEAPLSERLQRLGARYNADTSLDATRYYEVLPASALPALLALTGDRLSRPLAGVDDADVERERAIVENELNQRNELGVVGLVVGWMQQALYPPGHPYSRPIGGTVASLRRLTLADARRFVATHYRTDNATLLVTGDIGGPTPLASVATMLPAVVTARRSDRPPSPRADTGRGLRSRPARRAARRLRRRARHLARLGRDAADLAGLESRR